MRPKLVVVIPHHILHYFPFAGLVTRLDTANRGPTEMVKPGFLIQEPFVLVNAPSLVSWDAPAASSRCVDSRGQASWAFPRSRDAAPAGSRGRHQELSGGFRRRVQTVIKGEKATESQALALLAQPGLVFFATHGHNVPDAPLESFLLCYPDDCAGRPPDRRRDLQGPGPCRPRRPGALLFGPGRPQPAGRRRPVRNSAGAAAFRGEGRRVERLGRLRPVEPEAHRRDVPAGSRRHGGGRRDGRIAAARSSPSRSRRRSQTPSFTRISGPSTT